MMITVFMQWIVFLPLAYLAGPVLGFGLLTIWLLQGVYARRGMAAAAGRLFLSTVDGRATVATAVAARHSIQSGVPVDVESAPAVAAASNPITPKHKLLMIIDFPDRGLLRHVSPQQAGGTLCTLKVREDNDPAYRLYRDLGREEASALGDVSYRRVSRPAVAVRDDCGEPGTHPAGTLGRRCRTEYRG